MEYISKNVIYTKFIKLFKSCHIGNFFLYLQIQNEIMKRIIAKRVLKEFWEKHSDSEQYLKTWYDIAKMQAGKVQLM